MSELNVIYELDPGDSKLLFSNQLNKQHIEIHEYRKLRWLRIDGLSVQSVMHIEKPDNLISPINKAMCLGLIFPNQCETLLNIGVGGGAFERCFRSKLPDLMIDSIEANEIIIHLARDYFHLPYDYPVYNRQADNYLQTVDQDYDIILCDIFDDENHPQCLYEEGFYENAARNLASDGVLSLNLTPKNEQDLVKLLLPLRKSFSWTRLLEINEHRNVIVFAGNQEVVDTSTLEHRCDSLGKKIGIDFLEMLTKIHTLPESRYAHEKSGK